MGRIIPDIMENKNVPNHQTIEMHVQVLACPLHSYTMYPGAYIQEPINALTIGLIEKAMQMATCHDAASLQRSKCKSISR
jgi:hypothetical protein